jgi:hypothetical protein
MPGRIEPWTGAPQRRKQVSGFHALVASVLNEQAFVSSFVAQTHYSDQAVKRNLVQDDAGNQRAKKRAWSNRSGSSPPGGVSWAGAADFDTLPSSRAGKPRCPPTFRPSTKTPN